ncbi:cytochrome c oxidase subunit II [Gorillibacterium sp. sgz5001074]|uniref:cytochrome c oxidase subunit II n=1 Tax=Gorillibacterium sp. sgz5001074 TaxID=3446695 RepID=UPI003F67B0F2
MHIHRLEKIWLTIGISMLIVFLAVLGVGAFAMGFSTPDSHGYGAVDPTTVAQQEPFNKPGLLKIGDNEYNAYMLSFAFGYSPANMEIPKGATVHFYVTSTDVVHGFNIIGTTVNIMAVPGEVNHITHTFDKTGEFLLLCNEYCGLAHEQMATKIIVK